MLDELEAGRAIFPSEPAILRETRQDGTIYEYWFSPPVQYNKKAWRFRASRSISPEGKVSTSYSVEVTSGWAGWSSKDSWAACTYHDGPQAHASFRRDYDDKQPKPLSLRWYLPMMEFLYQHDAAALEERRQNYHKFKAYEAGKADKASAARRAHDARFGKLEDGDLAFTTSGYNYSKHLGPAYTLVRMFVMKSVHNRRGLQPHIWVREWGRCVPVTVSHARHTTFMKAGPEALAEIDISNHQKASLMSEAEDFRNWEKKAKQQPAS